MIVIFLFNQLINSIYNSSQINYKIFTVKKLESENLSIFLLKKILNKLINYQNGQRLIDLLNRLVVAALTARHIYICGVVYLKLSFYFVPVMFKGGSPLHSLVLCLKSTFLFPKDLLVGLLQSLLSQ